MAGIAAMKIKEITAKSILSKSQVSDYAVNPYVGCQHACVYCYAKFMKRFTGHREAWGEFVDVKINAPELLAREVAKKKVGRVWISGVCDPYQPLETEVPPDAALSRGPRGERLACHGPDQITARAAGHRYLEAGGRHRGRLHHHDGR